jgi:hypothetical protein
LKSLFWDKEMKTSDEKTTRNNYHSCKCFFCQDTGAFEKRTVKKWGFFLIFCAALLTCSTCHAKISEEKAVLAIIGEAENQGYEGMLAVAGAIRNRGTLKGVYGLNSPRVKKCLYSKETLRLAVLAWVVSEKLDITHGANHWENIKAFGKPKWALCCRETFRYKSHVFYKGI